MPLKRCPKCGETKAPAEFGKNRSRRDGLQDYCKECNRRYYEENREARLEYGRRYREENYEAVREYGRRYYEENREAEREKCRRYREENREAVREYGRRYYEENREAEREKCRRYREENRALTTEVATRAGVAWTEAEDGYLMSSSDPATVQAVELGRTHSSVQYRREQLRKKAKASA